MLLTALKRELTVYVVLLARHYDSLATTVCDTQSLVQYKIVKNLIYCMM